MSTIALPGGTVHALPADFADTITKHESTTKLWGDITPLARNEWICWVTSGKLEATREKRIKTAISKMKAGERRPCCWIGCIHRIDKPMSNSQKWVINRSKRDAS